MASSSLTLHARRRGWHSFASPPPRGGGSPASDAPPLASDGASLSFAVASDDASPRMRLAGVFAHTPRLSSPPKGRFQKARSSASMSPPISYSRLDDLRQRSSGASHSVRSASRHSAKASAFFGNHPAVHCPFTPLAGLHEWCAMSSAAMSWRQSPHLRKRSSSTARTRPMACSSCSQASGVKSSHHGVGAWSGSHAADASSIGLDGIACDSSRHSSTSRWCTPSSVNGPFVCRLWPERSERHGATASEGASGVAVESEQRTHTWSLTLSPSTSWPQSPHCTRQKRPSQTWERTSVADIRSLQSPQRR
mmetsp:Transcript_27951/g.69430  ORF Transcript_27951/g.69430 Transcript_27951/m.69430 type:complete len:308 (-) Transcript_27951:178-1101(-)